MKGEQRRLRDVGEDALVEAFTRGLRTGGRIVAGAGDDCAVLREGAPGKRLLLKSDCIVEGVHFERDAAPRAIGWKAIARAASDVAAMGGVPRYALVTMVLSPGMKLARAKAIYAGLRRAARELEIDIVGGETARVGAEGGMVISVSLTGDVEAERCVLRSGGRAGDVLYVTGRLGGSGSGGHLRFRPRIEEARWLTKHFKLGAMMDLSDGLAKDLPRLARASGQGFELDTAALPRNRGCDVDAALGDGEDYELLFAVGARDSTRLEEKWKRRFPRLPLTRIGRLVSDRKAGRDLAGGWDHFER